MNKDPSEILYSGSKSPASGPNVPGARQRNKSYASSPQTHFASEPDNFALEERSQMDPKDVFAKALDQATMAIQHLDLELDNPTPYKGLSLRELLNHMMNELMRVPALLHGKTAREVGTVHERDLLGTDPISAWMHAADSALLSVNRANDTAVVHGSNGDIPASEYIEEIGRDIFIHTWDVGQAMHATVLLEPEVAQAIYDHDISRKNELSQGNEFAPALEAPEGSRFQAKFLALYGRREPSASPAS